MSANGADGFAGSPEDSASHSPEREPDDASAGVPPVPVDLPPQTAAWSREADPWLAGWQAFLRHFQEPLGTGYVLTRWIFLRGLGVIYLIAFVSLWTQLAGLIGHVGILPASDFLQAVRRQTGAERFWQAPTLCWFGAGELSLYLQCALGIWASVLLIVGVASGPAALLAWALYLSLCTVGQVFLEYQWDILLLETGLLAIFFAPWHWLPRPSSQTPPARAVVWLLRWLLFRLMFLSGVVKLASGDVTWRHLTALDYHYQTQPLPTWVAWYAHQLPNWFQATCVLFMFAIELAVPWLIFLPRRFRLGAAVTFVLFQLLIAVTGNYCFFNLLTMLLCVPLLDDGMLVRFVPRRLRAVFASTTARPAPPRFRAYAVSALAGVVLAVSGAEMYGRLFGYASLAEPALTLVRWTLPFRSINTYGLFAVMTRHRFEIVVEGSNDGEHWQAYEFKWKPGELKRRPGFVAPHQPRLDWQMWFAALGSYQQNPWFMRFALRLLQGSPPVLALLEKNPFPNAPPRYLRARLYEYHFTDFATRRLTGQWWWREPQGLYCPVLGLDSTPRSAPPPSDAL